MNINTCNKFRHAIFQLKLCWKIQGYDIQLFLMPLNNVFSVHDICCLLYFETPISMLMSVWLSYSSQFHNNYYVQQIWEIFITFYQYVNIYIKYSVKYVNLVQEFESNCLMKSVVCSIEPFQVTKNMIYFKASGEIFSIKTNFNCWKCCEKFHTLL